MDRGGAMTAPQGHDPAAPPGAYTRTPAYGAGATGPGQPPENPFQRRRPDTGDAGPRPAGNGPGGLLGGPAPRGSALLALALTLAWNVLALVGVLVFGWPPGNAYLLFWIENAVLGLCTLVKVATAGAPAGTILVNGRPRPGSPWLFAVFFAFHYGLFCVVHLVFTLIIAYKVGIEPTFWLLGLPAVLMVVRYSVETATTWFGSDGQRLVTSPGQAMAQPYPRIIVLHVAVLLVFSQVIGGHSERLDQLQRIVQPLVDGLPVAWQDQGVLVVVVLIAVKTVVDLLTTRWVLGGRRGADGTVSPAP